MDGLQNQAPGRDDHLQRPYSPVLAKLRLLAKSEILALLRELDPSLLKSALEPEDTRTEEPANRRASQRSRTLRSGKIIYNNQLCVLDCLVRDVSPTGCRIRVTNPDLVPNHFVVQIVGTNQRHDCDVCWRNPQELGVKFAA